MKIGSHRTLEKQVRERQRNRNKNRCRQKSLDSESQKKCRIRLWIHTALFLFLKNMFLVLIGTKVGLEVCGLRLLNSQKQENWSSNWRGSIFPNTNHLRPYDQQVRPSWWGCPPGADPQQSLFSGGSLVVEYLP